MNKRILIIDDDLDFLEELKELLQLGGYLVRIVNNSMDALGWVNKFQPHVILLDLKMSPFSGFLIADRLRDVQERKDMIIIAMSGFFTESEHRKLVEHCGIEAFLIKPIAPVNVISKIEFELGKKK